MNGSDDFILSGVRAFSRTHAARQYLCLLYNGN